MVNASRMCTNAKSLQGPLGYANEVHGSVNQGNQHQQYLSLPPNGRPGLGHSHPFRQDVVVTRSPDYASIDTTENPIRPVHQPTPRQRTAVACGYCRRRKVNYQSLEDLEIDTIDPMLRTPKFTGRKMHQLRPAKSEL